jgi:hypothetical protein
LGVIGPDDALGILADARHHGEQPLCGVVHQGNFPSLIGDDDGVGD